ncbi:DEAD/DEAH box helicase [Thermococcus thioreducens]|uniref:RNA helicase n=1 Tax=Thermococcus thioreducens TaxID=277988 RepID=A0A1I0M8Z4_9EURY|nr:DEAD/DEAH box helicase [Thermococcus thioreducens]ASJ12885.1 RNA helicase [Thermococcus thioreducens]SEV83841.1 ATP-dependent RNA helicase DeaD [Thermococcus thioreducens]
MSFERLGLSEATLVAVREKGFETPTDIQREVIPRLLSGDVDIIGQSQTGTGKTAAFALPIIEAIDPKIRAVQAIILTPTRELALQVADEIKSLRGRKRVYVYAVYGGQPIGPQIRALERGTHVIVGTPGRVLDHIRRGTLDLSSVKFFILDEADRMLDMGFIDDIEAIFRETPRRKRVLMFSATMPPEIRRLARRYMKNHEVISVSSDELVPEMVDQEYVEVVPAWKFTVLKKILGNDFYGIVFCATKRETRELSERLRRAGYSAEALNGDMSQNARERTFWRFKTKRTRILVATDVAARGLDVQDISHIVNYSLPMTAEDYVHRIGRTGRMGKRGRAITFIMPGEFKRLRYIAQVVGVEIRKSELSEEIPREYRERYESDRSGYYGRSGRRNSRYPRNSRGYSKSSRGRW